MPRVLDHVNVRLMLSLVLINIWDRKLFSFNPSNSIEPPSLILREVISLHYFLIFRACFQVYLHKQMFGEWLRLWSFVDFWCALFLSLCLPCESDLTRSRVFALPSLTAKINETQRTKVRIPTQWGNACRCCRIMWVPFTGQILMTIFSPDIRHVYTVRSLR